MHWIWSAIAVATGQRVRVKQGGSGKSLYLTFDDGPSPAVTPELLDLLAQHQVKATFFLLGHQAKLHGDIVRRMVSEGHLLGNHSMNHPSFRKLTPAAQLKEVDTTDDLLMSFDGLRRHPFRPPRGHATLTTIASAVWRAQPLVLWNMDSFDFKLPEPELVNRLQAYVPQHGDIVLFHDDMPATVAALRQLLPRWRDAGFSFETV